MKQYPEFEKFLNDAFMLGQEWTKRENLKMGKKGMALRIFFYWNS